MSVYSNIKKNINLNIRLEMEQHKKSGQDILVFVAIWQQYKYISYISFDDAIDGLRLLLENLNPV